MGLLDIIKGLGAEAKAEIKQHLTEEEAVAALAAATSESDKKAAAVAAEAQAETKLPTTVSSEALSALEARFEAAQAVSQAEIARLKGLVEQTTSTSKATLLQRFEAEGKAFAENLVKNNIILPVAAASYAQMHAKIAMIQTTVDESGDAEAKSLVTVAVSDGVSETPKQVSLLSVVTEALSKSAPHGYTMPLAGNKAGATVTVMPQTTTASSVEHGPIKPITEDFAKAIANGTAGTTAQ